MLGRSYSTAVPFAQDLSDKGIILNTTPSSVLGELCSLSNPLDIYFNGSNTDDGKKVPETSPPDIEVETFGRMMAICTRGPYENDVTGSLWGVSFDNSVSKLASLLRNQISYIRNIVVPRVIEFSKEADLFLQEIGTATAASELEICKVTIPDILQDQAFLTLLEPYKHKKPTTPRNYSLSLNVPAKPEDFLTVASTSNARTDALVEEWYKTADMKYLDLVWHAFFADEKIMKSYVGLHISQDDVVSPNLGVRMNVALAYFLIANYYNNHLPDMVTKEDAASLKRRISEHLFFAGSSLCDVLYRIEQNNRLNIMVYHIDKFHKKITVSSEVYDRWLASGGSAETVLGILVGNSRFYSVPEIDLHSKELKQTWNNYTAIYSNINEHKKAHTLRTFYLSLLSKYMKGDYQDAIEKAYVQSYQYVYSKVMKEAESFLETLTKECLCNTMSVSKTLIAGKKYQFTYALKFINDMEDIGNDEKIIPEEAAMIATINYIVDYLHGQIRAVKV